MSSDVRAGGRSGSRTPVSIRSDRGGEPIGEESLSRFFADYVQHGRTLRHLARHPVSVLRALLALRTLPVVDVRIGAVGDGLAVRAALARPWKLAVLRGVNAVLELPASRDEYLRGRSKHSLRQNIRAAERRGLTTRSVDDPDERRTLLRYADAYERVNPVLEFRTDSPENRDMLPMAVWVLAEGADGTPLLLAVAAVDGPFAVLRYYRTLVDADDASLARYLAMPTLLDVLRARGVTHLAETARPQWLPNGLRQFQRKVGFRLKRLRLRSDRGGRGDQPRVTDSASTR